MPDSIKGSGDGFLRQRRNLILASTVILFLSISGATITKDVTLLNVTLAITKMHYLYFALWLVWWWFLYRYHQYYKQEGAALVKGAVNRRLTEAIHHYLNRLTESEQVGKSSSDNGYRHYQDVRRKSFFRVCAQLGILKHDSYGGRNMVHDWEEIDLRFYWKELIQTYYDFLMRRSEFTDYLFPMVFAVMVFVYSYFMSDWDGSIWRLIAR
jgi:hypothetical protein